MMKWAEELVVGDEFTDGYETLYRVESVRTVEDQETGYPLMKLWVTYGEENEFKDIFVFNYDTRIEVQEKSDSK